MNGEKIDGLKKWPWEKYSYELLALSIAKNTLCIIIIRKYIHSNKRTTLYIMLPVLHTWRDVICYNNEWLDEDALSQGRIKISR